MDDGAAHRDGVEAGTDRGRARRGRAPRRPLPRLVLLGRVGAGDGASAWTVFELVDLLLALLGVGVLLAVASADGAERAAPATADRRTVAAAAVAALGARRRSRRERAAGRAAGSTLELEVGAWLALGGALAIMCRRALSSSARAICARRRPRETSAAPDGMTSPRDARRRPAELRPDATPRLNRRARGRLAVVASPRGMDVKTRGRSRSRRQAVVVSAASAARSSAGSGRVRRRRAGRPATGHARQDHARAEARRPTATPDFKRSSTLGPGEPLRRPRGRHRRRRRAGAQTGASRCSTSASSRTSSSPTRSRRPASSSSTPARSRPRWRTNEASARAPGRRDDPPDQRVRGREPADRGRRLAARDGLHDQHRRHRRQPAEERDGVGADARRGRPADPGQRRSTRRPRATRSARRSTRSG